MTGPQPIRIRLNGSPREIEGDPRRKLLWVLRDQLGLFAAKYGCGEAQCGACTVLVDDVPVRSCVRTLASCSGRSVTTLEGLAGPDRLHPVQQAFLDEGAMQCGYCTAGMIVSAVGLLRARPSPTEAEIVRAMNGNLCRCGTYPRIVRAIARAAKRGGGGAR